MTLSLGPASRTTTTFEIGQDGLLPRVETLAMHELSYGTILVVTDDLDRIVKRVQSYKGITAKTFSRRGATTCRTLIIIIIVVIIIITVVTIVMSDDEIIVHMIRILVTCRSTTSVISEATAGGVTIAVAPRGHGSRKGDLESRRSRFS